MSKPICVNYMTNLFRSLPLIRVKA